MPDIGSLNATSQTAINGYTLFDIHAKTPGTSNFGLISPDTTVTNRNPKDTGWGISTHYSAFGGEDGATKFVDPAIWFGYNVAPSGQKDPLLHSAYWAIEADYWDTNKQNTEIYATYYKANSSGAYTRPFFFQIANSAYSTWAVGDVCGSFIKADTANGFYINNGAFGENGGNGHPLFHVSKLGTNFNLYTTAQTYTASFGLDKDSGGITGVTSAGTLFDLYGPSGTKFRFQQTGVAGYCAILVDTVAAAYLIHGSYGFPAASTVWQIGASNGLDDIGGNGAASLMYVCGQLLPAGCKTFHASAGRSSTNDVGRFTAWNSGVAITSITKGASTVVGVASHSMHVGGRVRFDNAVGGMTQIRLATGLITAQDANSITVDINSTAYTTWTSGGTINGEGLVAVSARGGLRIRDAVVVPSTPAASEIELWWDEAANALKFINAAGTTKTITAI